MAEIFDVEEIEEKVILVGVSEQDGDHGGSNGCGHPDTEA